jgi:hypothetical protein
MDLARNPFPAKLKADMDDLSQLGEKFDDSEGLGEEGASGFYDFRDWMDACAPEDPSQTEVQGLDTTGWLKGYHFNTMLTQHIRW